eukprot:scaffold81254_cov60-Cyclotella_meneghiniana.AAC.4
MSHGPTLSQLRANHNKHNTKTSQQSRRINRNTNTMPTSEEINDARLRGAIARNAADQQLLHPDQKAQTPKYRRSRPTLSRRHYDQTAPTATTINYYQQPHKLHLPSIAALGSTN